MSTLKRLASETAVYGLSSIVGRMLNYLLVPFHTRVMATGDYGVVSYLYAAAAFLMVVLSLRLETAYFRFASDKHHKENNVFGTALWLVMVFCIAVLATVAYFSSDIAAWIGYPGRRDYVLLFAGIVGLDVVSEIPLARLRRSGRAWRFAGIRLTMIGVNILTNVLLLAWLPYAAQHPDALFHAAAVKIFQPDRLVAYVFWANVVASLVMWLLLLPSALAQGLPFDGRLARNMLVYALPLVVVGLAGIVNESLDRWLLMNYLPGSQAQREQAIGIYSACYKLAMLVALFTQAYRYAVEPFFFNRAGSTQAETDYARVSRYYTWFGSLAFVFVMMALPWLQYFVAAPYRNGLHIVPLLLFSNILLGLYYNVSVWYRLKDKTLMGALIAVAGAGVTVVSNIYLIPRYHIYGAAMTHVICYTFMTITTAIIGRRFMRIPYQVPHIVGYMASAVVLWLAVTGIERLLGLTDWVQFIVRVSAFAGWILLWLGTTERAMALRLPVVGRFFK